MSSCVSCRTPTTKYKCPQCSVYYCSAPCYKTHKATTNSCNVETQKIEDDIEKEPTLHEPFSTEDTVPQRTLELLRTAPELLNLLYNPHLRSLLREIDVAPHAWSTMKKAMQEPLFIEFADQCLKIIEPIE